MQKHFKYIILFFLIIFSSNSFTMILNELEEMIVNAITISSSRKGYENLLPLLISEYPDIYKYLPYGHPFDSKNYKLSSPFGYRNHPIEKQRKMHTGLDIACEYATNVRSTANGVVIFADYKGGYGFCVDVEHKYGYMTRYGHLSYIFCELGDTITKNDIVGFVGTSGSSTGDHLHYEIRKNTHPLDPMPYLD